MSTVFWVVVVGVLVIGAIYAVLGIKRKESEDITEIICANTNCGYKGEPSRKKQFSIIVFIGLCLLWLLPGIIYAIVVPKYKYWCPKCKMKVSV